MHRTLNWGIASHKECRCQNFDWRATGCIECNCQQMDLKAVGPTENEIQIKGGH